MQHQFILVNEQVAPFIASIQINRPKERNALNRELMLEIRDTLKAFDENSAIRVIILTGEKVFLQQVQT
jgi:enoyl-CoA hydratase